MAPHGPEPQTGVSAAVPKSTLRSPNSQSPATEGRTGASAAAEAPRSPSGRITNGLVAVGAAAVLAIYAAGYERTRAAYERLEQAETRRRPAAVVEAAPVDAPTVSSEAAAVSPAVQVPTATRLVSAPTALGVSPEVPAAPAVPRAVQAQRENRPAAAAASTTPAPAASEAAQLATPSVAAPTTPTPAAEPLPAPATATAGDANVASVVSATPAPAAPAYKDGTYTGWGTSRHGDIQATVVISDGRIASAVISECWTRYPCSWIVKLPPQVAERQSPEVDYVSGATQSTNAFYYAVVQALAKAK